MKTMMKSRTQIYLRNNYTGHKVYLADIDNMKLKYFV